MAEEKHVFVPNNESVWELAKVISVDDSSGTISVQGTCVRASAAAVSENPQLTYI